MDNPKPLIRMPIKAVPYQHQINAFNFVCISFELIGGDDVDCKMQPMRKRHQQETK